MSANSSWPINNTDLSSVCEGNVIEYYMFLVVLVANSTVVLPLSVTVLNLGFQQWRQKRSATASVSFSDFFSYNLAVLELIGASGGITLMFSTIPDNPVVSAAMLFIYVFPWNGQMIFPILTSADRYLAVVHPVTYLQLKQRGGVCIRNICTLFSWAQSFMGAIFVTFLDHFNDYMLILASCLSAVYLLAMTFFSISVLRVLIRPRPGDAAGDRVRLTQTKRRAFNTIIIIMGVLVLRFGGTLGCYWVRSSPSVSFSVRCMLGQCSGIFSLPSSLVLPLLFLHRAGKLPGCRRDTHSG